jgi:hypothetical protein
MRLALAFYRPRRRHREDEFTGAVVDEFRGLTIEVERQCKLTGRSGHKHVATIYRSERETVIEPIPADGHWNQVTAVYAKFGDRRTPTAIAESPSLTTEIPRRGTRLANYYCK